MTEIPVEELNRKFRPTRSGARRAPGMAPATFATDRTIHERTSAEPTNPVPRGPLTAQDRAERWILAVLLAEPHRWQEVQQHVSASDFTDPLRRGLAEKYWTYQREEGEPVFNEFLGFLTDAGLVELAIKLVDEAAVLSDLDVTLRDSVAHLATVGRQREERRKLVAQLRRTSGESDSPDASSAGAGSQSAQSEEDQVRLLRQVYEKARRPDMGWQ